MALAILSFGTLRTLWSGRLAEDRSVGVIVAKGAPFSKFALTIAEATSAFRGRAENICSI
jgi:hypothetical protein